jgi:hypothetical protein
MRRRRPALVKGFMQLYSVDQKRSQALEAHAAAFATLKARRRPADPARTPAAPPLLNKCMAGRGAEVRCGRRRRTRVAHAVMGTVLPRGRVVCSGSQPQDRGVARMGGCLLFMCCKWRGLFC